MNVPDYKSLHDLYVQLTGRNVEKFRDGTLTMKAIYAWDIWLARGFTEKDLRLVVRYIKKRIWQKRRYPESLSFHNLIENTSRFGEDLAESHCEFRDYPDRNKQSVLRATGRPIKEHREPHHIKQDVEKFVEQLRNLRESL